MLQQLLINGIIAGSIYALIAIGFGLIYGTTRFFHFAHGAVFTAGAYFAYTFKVLWGLPFYPSLVLAVFLASLLGVLIEVVVYRPLRHREATSLILLLASLGVFIVIQNIISLIFGDDTKTIRSGIVQEGINIFGARITPIQITIMAVSVLLFVVSGLIIKYTKIGKAIRAVANDPELAKISGIDSERIILLTFLFGSALAGVAAILISLDTDMTPMMGFYALIMGVIAVIVGGVGSIPGAAFGGLLLGLAQHLGVWKISSEWQDAIAFVILLIFLLFRPYGFFGKTLKKVEV
ncbi:MAG: branched-chain amino acid ABC transporter permease [Thermodesulfobacteriota bacterium]